MLLILSAITYSAIHHLGFGSWQLMLAMASLPVGVDILTRFAIPAVKAAVTQK